MYTFIKLYVGTQVFSVTRYKILVNKINPINSNICVIPSLIPYEPVKNQFTDRSTIFNILYV